ncbi:MAG: alpha/beta hydrolase [Prevotellaceae bacterium]|nr:alpha/beta hydrolase [Prevotellaceae bacterium]
MFGSCLLAACASASVSENDDALKFTAQGESRTLTMPDGKTVDYIAYEHIYYVTNVEDSTYQYLNFYVPQSAADPASDVPILLRNSIGGYMASKAHGPSETDASGRALSEGYAVCIPGARGTNSTVTDADGNTVYTGRVPAGLLDLKAAVRYLRHNDALMPGNAEKIVSDGTSAGGAMSSLLGATGNHPIYAPYLEAMGAADERDDIFAAVCYCPITDLDHADMAYEWLYSCTNKGIRNLTDEQCQVSEELAAQFPAYLNSLQLKAPDGTPLTDANYLDYIKSFLIRSVQRAVNEGCVIPDSIGIQMNMEPGWGPFPARKGEFVVDIDMPRYLAYIVSTVPLKMPPAFDSEGVLNSRPSRENEAFGDNRGSASNFTEYSLRTSTGDAGATLPEEIQQRARMMNPMYFIEDDAATTAPHWYIRHGARDRDTSFPVPVNLATKLQNNGYDVDFALPWNRPHSGDYNLDDLFCWMARVTK